MKTFDADNTTGKNHDGPHPNMPLTLLTASSIIGDEVVNLAEEKLGKISEIMINLKSGTIEYMVLELGGFLGIGEKFFAIPYQLFKVDAKNQRFILNQSKDTLEKAPGFNKEHWPETNTHEFDHSSSYWGGFMGNNSGSVPY